MKSKTRFAIIVAYVDALTVVDVRVIYLFSFIYLLY